MRTLALTSLLVAMAAPAAVAAPPTAAELAHRVPETASAVVAIDGAALRAQPAVHAWLLRLRALHVTDCDGQRFFDDAGLDPLRDVDVAVVAAVPDGDRTAGVALLAGRYDTAALGAALVKRGAQPSTIAGVPAYRLASDDEADGPAVVALASPGLVVVGSEATVTAALAPPHGLPELAATEVGAGRLDLGAPFWMVATVPPTLRSHAAAAAEGVHGEGAETVRGALFASGAVRRVVAQATVSDALRFSGTAVADTPENAELLRDTVKGAIAGMRLHFEASEPEFVDALRGVQVSLHGAVVTATGAVPVALIEKLAARHGATQEVRHRP